MASLPDPCFADAPMIAQDVARGVGRLFFRQDQFAICEVPLPNGRRADMVAIDSRRADHHRRDQGVARRPARRRQMARLSRLLRLFLLGGAGRLRARAVRLRGDSGEHCSGLIVADRYDAEVIRRGAAQQAAAGAAQGGDVALRPPRGAPPGRGDGSRPARDRLLGIAGRTVSGACRRGAASSRRGDGRVAACPAGHNRAPNSRRRCRVRLGSAPCREQQRDDVGLARLDRQDQRRLAAIVGEIDAGAAGEQLLAPSTQPIDAAMPSGVVPSLVWMSGRAPGRAGSRTIAGRGRARRCAARPRRCDGSRALIGGRAGLRGSPRRSRRRARGPPSESSTLSENCAGRRPAPPRVAASAPASRMRWMRFIWGPP